MNDFEADHEGKGLLRFTKTHGELSPKRITFASLLIFDSFKKQ